MWGDECYYSIEGECEFFQDWLKETKDEVFNAFAWCSLITITCFSFLVCNFFISYHYMVYYKQRFEFMSFWASGACI